jgi:hypothetical protein
VVATEPSLCRVLGLNSSGPEDNCLLPSSVDVKSMGIYFSTSLRIFAVCCLINPFNLSGAVVTVGSIIRRKVKSNERPVSSVGVVS